MKERIETESGMNFLKKFNQKTDKTVRELFLGCLVWGTAGELVLCLFFRERLSYHSLGLWAGILMALAAAYHMWWALDMALEPGMPAQKLIAKHSMIRYAVIIILFAVIMLTDVMNPLTAFFGIMGLKAAAYMQPFIHTAGDKASCCIKKNKNAHAAHREDAAGRQPRGSAGVRRRTPCSEDALELKRNDEKEVNL